MRIVCSLILLIASLQAFGADEVLRTFVTASRAGERLTVTRANGEALPVVFPRPEIRERFAQLPLETAGVIEGQIYYETVATGEGQRTLKPFFVVDAITPITLRDLRPEAVTVAAAPAPVPGPRSPVPSPSHRSRFPSRPRSPRRSRSPRASSSSRSSRAGRAIPRVAASSARPCSSLRESSRP
jgi:hypothetical protein